MKRRTNKAEESKDRQVHVECKIHVDDNDQKV